MARTKQTVRNGTRSGSAANTRAARSAGKVPRRSQHLAGKAPRGSKEPKAAAKKKKPYRHRPGIVALREIRTYQKSSELLLRKAPFSRVVRDVLEGLFDNCHLKTDKYRWTKEALECVQVSVSSRCCIFERAQDVPAIKMWLPSRCGCLQDVAAFKMWLPSRCACHQDVPAFKLCILSLLCYLQHYCST